MEFARGGVIAARSGGGAREDEADALAWRVWPWTLFVPAAPLLALAFFALFAYAIVGARDGIWAALVVVAAWVVLGEFVFPVAYEVGEAGIEVRGPFGDARLFRWEGFERYRIPPGGRLVQLRFAGGGPARWWRRDLAVYVPEDPSLREELARTLRVHLGPAA